MIFPIMSNLPIPDARAGGSPFQAFIDERGFVLLDGGLATELERRGADLDHPLWSAQVLHDHPDLIREVHLDYFRAGADVATTATYQASFPGFERCDYTREEAAAYIRKAVTLAQEARDRYLDFGNAERIPIIAGSAGCYGAFLADGSEYQGRYGVSEAELIDFHRERLEILLDAEVDVVAFETIPCLIEAEAIAELLGEYTDIRAWIAFGCKDGMHVREGQRVRDCAAIVAESPQVMAIGVNCTAPMHVAPLLRELHSVTDKPLLAYPNSGETFDTKRRTWSESEDDSHWAGEAEHWYRSGARLIGGCCRTTPEDIQQLGVALERITKA